MRLIQKFESREWWAESERAAQQGGEKKALRALEDFLEDRMEILKEGSKGREVKYIHEKKCSSS